MMALSQKGEIMKRSHLAAALSIVVLLALGVVLAHPGSVEATEKAEPGVSQFVPEKGDGGQSFLQEPNCTWTCSDGRTGSAEVNTAEQCVNACSGACGGPCILVE